MKKSFAIVAILSSLVPLAAFAEMSPAVILEGSVDNFNDRMVEVVLEGGTKVKIPRAAVDAGIKPGVKVDQNLRPGKTVAAMVQLEEIQVVQPRAKR
jgi:hypothetical protein